MNMTHFKQYSTIVLFSLLTQEAFASSTGNIDSSNKYVWSTNSGWFNFRPNNGGVIVSDDHLEGYAWSENVGWIKLGADSGGGAPYYANTTSSNYGVNHDGNGNLSGYAWSTNVGWIKFDPANGGVTVDKATGDFDGYAWSENMGWIHFQNSSPAYNVSVEVALYVDLVAGSFRATGSYLPLPYFGIYYSRINWDSAMELDTNHFEVLRSDEPDGDYNKIPVLWYNTNANQNCIDCWEKLNLILPQCRAWPDNDNCKKCWEHRHIFAQGDGWRYEVYDIDVSAGKTYFYKLRDVDNFGNPTVHPTTSPAVIPVVGEWR
jgi:hypothetical protein